MDIVKQKTELQKQADARGSIFTMLKSEGFQNELKAALPKIMPLDKFTRSVITQVNKNIKLLKCTNESLFSSIINLAGAGLEADGYNAHILPYGTVATPIIDYKGMIELMFRSNKVAAVNGYTVCENDEFILDLGEVKKHSYDVKKPRGEVIGAFTIVRMVGGEKSFHFMTIYEIEEIGKTSPAWGNKYSPWVKHRNSMIIKTVLRQHSKWVPLSSEAKDIIMKEIEVEVLNNSKPQGVSMADLIGNKEPEETEIPSDEDIQVKSEEVEPTAKEEVEKMDSQPSAASGLDSAIDDLESDFDKVTQ